MLFYLISPQFFFLFKIALLTSAYLVTVQQRLRRCLLFSLYYDIVVDTKETFLDYAMTHNPTSENSINIYLCDKKDTV